MIRSDGFSGECKVATIVKERNFIGICYNLEVLWTAFRDGHLHKVILWTKASLIDSHWTDKFAPIFLGSESTFVLLIRFSVLSESNPIAKTLCFIR